MAAAASAGAERSLRVLVSGAGGMVGRALVSELSRPSAVNHFNPQVYRLVRRKPENEREVFWDPYEMRIDLKRCEGFDAVVHLAGENVGSGEGFLAFTGRWTERKKHDIMESRRRGTTLLSQAVASLRSKPRVLVSASGVGFYGDGGEAQLTEDSPPGAGFLGEVARVWEGSTAKAAEAGVRVVNLRFGAILSRTGGVIEKLHWPFFLGGGGPIGSGRQYMSWITLGDAVRAIQHAINQCVRSGVAERPPPPCHGLPAHGSPLDPLPRSRALCSEELSGPVNACAPQPVRNAEFVQELASAMGRPAFVPLPEPVVNAVFGEMGRETLLVSQRAVPKKLTESGFRFLHPDIRAGVREALSR